MPNKMGISYKEKIRIRETLDMIPADVVSILEVGCGDGRITNSICHKYKVMGIDIGKERIKAFQGTKIIADVSEIPIKDSKFDLVLAAEILEHLPDDVFYKAVSEMARVTKKYILITVPFRETLPAQWTECSECGHIFHAWGHLRRFDLRILKCIFSHARLMERKYFQPREAKIPSFAWIAVRKFGGVWGSHSESSIKCDKCGGDAIDSKGNILGWILLRLIWRLQKVNPVKKPIWIGCLYRKYF
jgi:SAM-dependent methyltransferase